MRVIGTAGHVDHGKSTLIEALTGIDPDRLKEEQEREMTIDLGFAWLTLPSGEQVGVVDVPGHLDFIKNMLAGIGSVDAALLVVAANESVMPQTREHLAILDLLEAPAGVVALTKVDLVETPEWLELVKSDVAETLKGTVLEGAPIVPVSAVTGLGIDELITTLDDVLRRSPIRPDRGRPRMPIDRVFSIAGFGTVVTGTLLDGRLQIGQEIEILPSEMTARIRGLQSHKQKIEVATPGSRVAVNLTGLRVEDVHRGQVLTVPGWLTPTKLVDVRLTYLADTSRPLRHNQEIEFFSGAAQTSARVRLLGTKALSPGEVGWAQIRLSQPMALVKGDHFIIRQPSPSLTIGGGVIVDPLPRRRHRRFRPDVIQHLEILAHGTPEELLLETLDRQGPMLLQTVVSSAPSAAADTVSRVKEMVDSGQAFTLPPHHELVGSSASGSVYILSNAGWQNLVQHISDELDRFHTENPLRTGMPREELKSRLKLDSRLFGHVVTLAAQQGILIEDGNTIRLARHTVRLSDEQRAAVDRVLQQFRQAPYATPSFKEVVAVLGTDLTQSLIDTGQLIRLNPEVLLLPATYEELVSWVKETIQQQGSVNVAALRDAYRTSRKYALAILEHLDDRRITKRVGDQHVLR